ncbi:unnamed protein product [Spirodela intermedia]|uniref:RING-type domain-containing protein n=1 Tax=Spirodela intermedia TaxID=51605 RepID=A0A7I8IKN9_SPIIN|nr:unnamed protein product [Spirodela intermedia]CAA6658439.1 unnamed protein product [Spirodela intermedia]
MGQRPDGPASVETTDDLEVGIDEATLATYPKLLYSRKAKAQEEYKGTNASCCSICLADYKDGDVLRLLPDCNHLFHLKCVDPWLRQHPTCPVCRASLFPAPRRGGSPLATALTREALPQEEEEDEETSFYFPLDRRKNLGAPAEITGGGRMLRKHPPSKGDGF